MTNGRRIAPLALVLAASVAPALAQDGQTQALDVVEGTPIAGTLFHQGENTVLATNLLDVDVVDVDGNDIGDVADLLLYPSGSLRGILFEVGGFLEVGEKVIAVDFSRLEIIRLADGGFAVQIDATEGELDEAPRFITRAEAAEFAQERADEVAERRAEQAEEPLQERADVLEERADALRERAETVEEETEERVEAQTEAEIEEEVLQ